MALINDFLSLIYPRYCEACGRYLFRSEHQICRLCKLTLPKCILHPQALNPVQIELGGRVPLQEALCLFMFEKSGRVQRLVHAIKYEGQKDLAVNLGKWLGREYLESGRLPDFDMVLPVPLHPTKQKLRGYNQSEEFAKGLCFTLQAQMRNDLLFRLRASSTQTRKKKFQRWQNVEGIFGMKDETQLEGRHVLLVDDVLTTGATVDAAWQAMQHIPGIRLSLACIAFAKQHA
ncbi:MAG TPA: phosphoribosyltransferase family protein [Bacteroidia bacterium]|nr:phosphoribosyltransferase family protein [Bacteroidia bacterium]